jgi:hypothetical protein
MRARLNKMWGRPPIDIYSRDHPSLAGTDDPLQRKRIFFEPLIRAYCAGERRSVESPAVVDGEASGF